MAVTKVIAAIMAMMRMVNGRAYNGDPFGHPDHVAKREARAKLVADPVAVKHVGFTCEPCKMTPILGPRYDCNECKNR
jgi:hypothetical protein